MKGNITQRGRKSWRLKFEAGYDEAIGRRRTQYHTFRGTKAEAKDKLIELLASVKEGTYVENNKLLIGEFVKARIDQWEGKNDITARTAARYRELLKNQIVPHLGEKQLQKLRPIDVETWHTTLSKDLAPRTIGHAHRVLGKALNDAVKNELVVKNVVKVHAPPKVNDEEMVIVKDVPGLVTKLQQANRLGITALVSLFTGMRLGEVLALKWNRVDLDKGVIQVREALENTKEHGLRFKTPKSKAGRRDVTLPDILINSLRELRKAQLELRMKVGAGKLPNDALLFGDIDGNPVTPNSVSAAWGDYAARIEIPDVNFHALRHTHASQLIDANVDIVTISKRLGHAKPDITLRIYAHLFRKDDSKAAAAINATMG